MSTCLQSGVSESTMGEGFLCTDTAVRSLALYGLEQAEEGLCPSTTLFCKIISPQIQPKFTHILLISHCTEDQNTRISLEPEFPDPCKSILLLQLLSWSPLKGLPTTPRGRLRVLQAPRHRDTGKDQQVLHLLLFQTSRLCWMTR